MLSAGQGSITVPGSIGATPIEAPIDLEEGLPVEVPLVYFFGHATPADHSELYKVLVERLANLLATRATSSPEVGGLPGRGRGGGGVGGLLNQKFGGQTGLTMSAKPTWPMGQCSKP